MLVARSPEGQIGLRALRADPGGSLVALDYDGTLAPIVDRPEEARPASGSIDMLVELAGRVRQLALVTGRPAQSVVELAGLDVIPGLVVMGQYGVERWAGGALHTVEPGPGLALARRELSHVIHGLGAQIEDKRLSLVVHTRNAPPGSLERLVAPLGELARRCGLDLHLGRLVLELRPPGFDKRGALLAVAEFGPTAVFFAGDDIGDAPAFDAIEELRSRGIPGLTVFSDSDEGPPTLRARADLVVAGPAGVVALLRELFDLGGDGSGPVGVS